MRPEKKAIVDMLAEKLSSVSSFILADYSGLSVQEMSELRRTLMKQESEFMVVPNRMLRLALRDVELGALDGYLAGPTAVAFGGHDAVKVAKILYDFSRDHKELRLKGGYLDKVTINGKQVEQVAKLPTRGELVARVVGQLGAPLSGLVLVLSGPARGFVSILSRVREGREK